MRGIAKKILITSFGLFLFLSIQNASADTAPAGSLQSRSAAAGFEFQNTSAKPEDKDGKCINGLNYAGVTQYPGGLKSQSCKQFQCPKPTTTGSSVTTPTIVEDCRVGPFLTGVALKCPCCGFCDVEDIVQTGVNGFNFMLGITGALALFVIVLGGGAILLGGANEKLKEWGKTAIKNAIIGVIIVFSSWLIVFIIVKALGGTFTEDGNFLIKVDAAKPLR